MSKVFLAAFSLFLCLPGYASAQTLRAITQDGKLVILNPDGTWTYAEQGTQKPDTPGGREQGREPAIRLFKGKTPVELKRGNYVLWLDATKWQVNKKQEDADRTTFAHVKGDAYAMAITERISIPIATLKKLAVNNVQEFAPGAKVTLDEMRRVNGLQVVCLKLAASIQGIEFTYYGYYHSNSQGTIQLLTYTSNNLFDEFQADFTDFLNSLTVK